MTASKLKTTTLLAALGLALASFAPTLQADDGTPPSDYPYYHPWGAGMGPGMMGGRGMGPGMMGSYGMGPGMMGGYGMGPGMMGGSGMGPGMMGGYGTGPGMMGGYGMGPGMMGGYGMGPGMMGGYGMGPMWLLDLSDEQVAKINAIRNDTRRKHWDIMGKYQEEAAKLRELYAAPTWDRNAIANTYKQMSALRQQMIESALDAHGRIEGVLTKEQKDRLHKFWRRGWQTD